MSRHNRRRTRGGHRNSKNLMLHACSFDGSSCQPSLESSVDVFLPPPLSRSATRAGATVSARQWHNRYAAWQARERRQREESASLEAEKRRIFGEADGTGEDEGLCLKMLEYFGGLDFIDG